MMMVDDELGFFDFSRDGMGAGSAKEGGKVKRKY